MGTNNFRGPQGSEGISGQYRQGHSPKAGHGQQCWCLERPEIASGQSLGGISGDLKGKHSIRINDQWRIVFRWTANGPEEVEIVDYH